MSGNMTAVTPSYISKLEEEIEKGVAELETAAEALESRISRILAPEASEKLQTQAPPAIPHSAHANFMESIAGRLVRLTSRIREVQNRVEL